MNTTKNTNTSQPIKILSTFKETGDFPSPSPSPPDSKPKVRCFLCNKKLNLIEETSGKCKCGNTFCSKHRCVKSENSKDKNCHPCSWEYLKKSQELLSQNNPVVACSKLERI